MVDHFEILGSRQIAFSLYGFLEIGEELELPDTHFTQGAICRVEKVLGQNSGQTRYLASLVRGRAIHPSRREDTSDHPQRETRRRDDGEGGFEFKRASERFYDGDPEELDGGGFYSTVEESTRGSAVLQDGEVPQREKNIMDVLLADPNQEAIEQQRSLSFDASKDRPTVKGGRRGAFRNVVLENRVDRSYTTPPPAQTAPTPAPAPTPVKFGVMTKKTGGGK